MRGTCVLFGVVVALAGVPGMASAAELAPAPATPAPATPAPATSHAPLPASLVGLEQKMAQIRFNSAQISERFAIGELGSRAGGAELGSGVGKSKNFVSVATGAIRLSPPALVVTDKLEGPEGPAGHSLSNSVDIETRKIGRTTYTYEPAVAGLDGGRPWVRSRSKPRPKPHGTLALLAAELAALAPTLTTTPSEHEGSFTKLIEELDDATSVTEGGPLVVDGQQVTEFTATISFKALLAGKLNRKELRAIGKHPREAGIELEVFIAPSGLPVRTTGISEDRTGGIGLEMDILALEVPVVVQVPPADKTIGQARLAKLESMKLVKKRHFKRLERKPATPG